LKEVEIETVTDFGDLQIFDGVTTYPVILTMRRHAAATDHAISFWKLEYMPEDNFSTAFRAAAQPFPQSKLGAGSWELENQALRALREKIVRGRKTLKEVYGSPQRGIVTGLNAAFTVDRATRDRLIRDDPKSKELLKPFLEGKDLKRWCAEPRDLWIIYIPKGVVDIEKYPAIKARLLPFKAQLEGRATKQNWFELQQAQAAYVPQFEAPKIVYGEFADENIFSIDHKLYYLNNKCYFVPTDDSSLLALLNSKIFRFIIEALSVAMRGNFTQLHSQYVELVPIPKALDLPGLGLGERSVACGAARRDQMISQMAFRRRISDLCTRDRDPKLNTKLTEWWTLEDFACFRDEIKKHYRAEIPLNERTQWEDWFSSGKAEVDKLSAEIARNEAEIDAIVYRLFDLTPDEITLLEESIR
jgi:hypothetical protein